MIHALFFSFITLMSYTEQMQLISHNHGLDPDRVIVGK